MAPKKQPAVRRETTLDETLAFLALAKPELPTGRPKSVLKLLKARTLSNESVRCFFYHRIALRVLGEGETNLPITPVSKPSIQVSMLHNILYS
jgi:hypothetical protein